jgi:hypothetical protein
MGNEKKEKAMRWGYGEKRDSYLALDVDCSEGLRTRAFKHGTGLAGQECNVFGSVFQQMLAVVVDDELGRISVGLKSEFFRDETQLHIWLVSATVG